MRSRFPIAALLLMGGFWTAACGHKTIVRPPVAPASRPATTPTQPATPVPPPVVPPSREPGKEPERTPIPTPSTPAPTVLGPPIRIGLTIPAEELRISSAGAFVLVEKTPEAPRVNVSGPVQIRLERAQTETGEIYRVQVAALASKAAAEKLGKQLSEQFGVPAVVRENSGTGTCQVRLGSFANRNQAQEFASGPVVGAGYRDAFVVVESGTAAKGEPTLALRGPDNLFRVSKTGYLFMPAAELKFLQINGKAYRGVLDISLSKDGRITAVNQLSMEEYLFGVVPAELSPVIYPQQAALEAQAIAARTYALKSMGHRTDGFDLTDDTSMQVYGGASIEKEATNNAVQKTSGIAIYYNGSLIEALYMSTCGGRTEDSSEVFDTAPVPYLKSVFCTVDSGGSTATEANLTGTHYLSQVLIADDGAPVNRELELAQVLGLIPLDRDTQRPIADPADPDEIKRWVEKSRALGGKIEKEAPGKDSTFTSRAGFLGYATEQFFGSREIARSISDADVDYYMSNFADGARVPASARRALAFLVQRKLWQPYPDNSIRPDDPIRRCDALALLVRWILSAKPEILVTGIAADPNAAGGNSGGSTLAVKRGNRTEHLRLTPDTRLFKISGGRSAPVEKLRVIGNEKLAYHLGAGGIVDFLEVELSATGAASDRFSPVASWQKTITRATAAEKLRPMAPNIGELLDLKPAKFGASGRVVKLEIIGSRGSVVVNGYQARGKLGLNDTLYTLTRTRTDDGSIASFTFDGRGWGHGVGLCQTGAVGMALAGRSAEDILKTYYQGVELRKIY